jgi:GxxExxY protein
MFCIWEIMWCDEICHRDTETQRKNQQMAEGQTKASGVAAAAKRALSETEALNALTERIIGCAIEVHRQLGPGLLEGTYESALCIELNRAGLQHIRQPISPVMSKGQVIGEYRLDLIVENLVVVEIKSVERFDPIF